jgi:5'-3' exonuclease
MGIKDLLQTVKPALKET